LLSPARRGKLTAEQSIAPKDFEHPTRGTYSMIGCPVRLSDSPFEASPAPLMGEHTEAVLTALAGYTAEEVKVLREKGVI
jgi:formyl-CoA transferase